MLSYKDSICVFILNLMLGFVINASDKIINIVCMLMLMFIFYGYG
jgi:hypothetical protein